MVKVAMVSVLRVSDVMSRDVFTLHSGTAIEEAARQLLDRHVGGAPVVEGHRVVGVVSKSDLLDPRIERTHTGPACVADVMTPMVYGVRASDPAVLAARLMVDESIHRVIVLGPSNDIVGIVTSSDLLRALVSGWQPRGEGSTDPAAAELEYVDLRRLAPNG